MTPYERAWQALIGCMALAALLIAAWPSQDVRRVAALADSLAVRVEELAIAMPTADADMDLSHVQETQIEFAWRKLTAKMNSGERAAFLESLMVADAADSGATAAEREAWLRGYNAARDSTR